MAKYQKFPQFSYSPSSGHIRVRLASKSSVLSPPSKDYLLTGTDVGYHYVGVEPSLGVMLTKWHTWDIEELGPCEYNIYELGMVIFDDAFKV
jgi:hypothetical protein